jgi:hypothetical protein
MHGLKNYLKLLGVASQYLLQTFPINVGVNDTSGSDVINKMQIKITDEALIIKCNKTVT